MIIITIKPFLLSYSCSSPWPPPAGCGYPPSRRFHPGLEQITFTFENWITTLSNLIFIEISIHYPWRSLSTLHHRGNPTQVWNRSLSTFENWITILSNLISTETSIHYPCSLHVDHYQPPPRQFHPGLEKITFHFRKLDKKNYPISYLLRRLSTIQYPWRPLVALSTFYHRDNSTQVEITFNNPILDKNIIMIVNHDLNNKNMLM